MYMRVRVKKRKRIVSASSAHQSQASISINLAFAIAKYNEEEGGYESNEVKMHVGEFMYGRQLLNDSTQDRSVNVDGNVERIRDELIKINKLANEMPFSIGNAKDSPEKPLDERPNSTTRPHTSRNRSKTSLPSL